MMYNEKNANVISNATTIGYENKPIVKAETKKEEKVMKVKKQNNITTPKQHKASNFEKERKQVMENLGLTAHGNAKPVRDENTGELYSSIGAARAIANAEHTFTFARNITLAELKKSTVVNTKIKKNTDTFYTKLGNICKDKGTNFGKVSEKLNKHYDYLYALKSSGSFPSVAVLLRIADILGVSLDYLFDREVENK